MHSLIGKCTQNCDDAAPLVKWIYKYIFIRRMDIQIHFHSSNRLTNVHSFIKSIDECTQNCGATAPFVKWMDIPIHFHLSNQLTDAFSSTKLIDALVVIYYDTPLYHGHSTPPHYSRYALKNILCNLLLFLWNLVCFRK